MLFRVYFNLVVNKYKNNEKTLCNCLLYAYKSNSGRKLDEFSRNSKDTYIF